MFDTVDEIYEFLALHLKTREGAWGREKKKTLLFFFLGTHSSRQPPLIVPGPMSVREERTHVGPGAMRGGCFRRLVPGFEIERPRSIRVCMDLMCITVYHVKSIQTLIVAFQRKNKIF